MNKRALARMLFSSSTPWSMPRAELDAFVANALATLEHLDDDHDVAGALADTDLAAAHPARSTLDVQGGVAVIPIHGVLSKFARFGTSPFGVQEQIAEAVRSKRVRGIILDVDSPGGSVAGIEETANQVFNARRIKPVVAHVHNLAASAAYWIASQATEIVVAETALVANIGVYIVVVDWSALFAREGVKVEVVKRGELKGAGALGTVFTDTQRAEFQRIVDRIGDVFVRHVARGRGMSIESAEALADGRLWVGAEAVERDVANSTGSIADAVRLVLDTANRSPAPRSARVAVALDAVLDDDAVEAASVAELRGAFVGAVNDVLPDEKQNTDPATVVASDSVLPGADAPNIGAQTMPLPTKPKAGATSGAVATPEPPIAASSAETTPPTGESPPTAPVASGAPPAPVNASPPEQHVAAERERAAEVSAIADSFGFGATWAGEQIRGGQGIEAVRKIALDRIAAARKPAPVSVVGDRNVDTLEPAIRQALQIGAGEVIPEADRHPRVREFLGRPLTEICRAHLSAYGHPNANMMTPIECARAVFNPGSYMSGVAMAGVPIAGSIGHSTSDFPIILEGTINATLQRAYDENPGSWDRVFRRAPARDFREIARKKLSGFSTMPAVAEGEEYTQATLAEDKEVYTVGKYGYIFVISWEGIINDDLDAFGRIPRRQALAARRLENRTAWSPFVVAVGGETMQDGVVLFHANHNNLAGSPAALSTATLSSGRQAIREQTGLNSEDLDLIPVFLIVPPALETVADQLINSETDPAKSASGIKNVMQGKFELIVENQLGVAGGRVGKSDTAFYLAASHQQIDTVEVAFLMGNERPFLERRDGFSTDGREYKIRHVVGAKAIDHRGVYKDAGV